MIMVSQLAAEAATFAAKGDYYRATLYAQAAATQARNIAHQLDQVAEEHKAEHLKDRRSPKKAGTPCA